MVTSEKLLFKFKFSETLKGNSNTLQNLLSVQLRDDEMVGGRWNPPPPLVIKCGSEIAWYKKGLSIIYV